MYESRFQELIFCLKLIGYAIAIILALKFAIHFLLISISSCLYAKWISTGKSLAYSSDKCYKCHGPDGKNQKSDFRIDSFEEAVRKHNGFVGLTLGNLKILKPLGIHSDDPIDDATARK